MCSQRRGQVVLAGDHGVWYGDFYERARAGRLEAKMPALFLLPPAGMARRRPDAAARLRGAEPALTTPRDVHATLVAWLAEHRPVRGEGGGGGGRGQSQCLVGAVDRGCACCCCGGCSWVSSARVDGARARRI
jgi:hypothetical protein